MGNRPPGMSPPTSEPLAPTRAVFALGGVAFLVALVFALPAHAQTADEADEDRVLEVPVDAPASAEAFASLEEGFGVRSVDGALQLRIGGMFAVRSLYDAPDPGENSGRVELRLGRLFVSGHALARTLRWFAQLEMAGGVRLLDLELTIAPLPELTIRIGRFRTPAGREWLTPLNNLALIDRSVVSDFFRSDRDTGASLEGRLFDGILEYRAGVFDETLTSSPLITGRLAIDPLGAMPYDETTARAPGDPRMSFGVWSYRVARQRRMEVVDLDTGVVTSVTGPETERRAVGGDFALRVGPVDALAEIFFDRRRPEGGASTNGAGAIAQVGVFVIPGLLQLAARYDWLTTDREASTVGMQRVEVGCTLSFLEAHLKLQPRYTYTHTDDAVAASLPPLARSGHLVDLQLLLAI